KTLDFSGGRFAYAAIAEAGRAAHQAALSEAHTRGVGTGESSVNPHGSATTWPEVMQRVMRQIGANVKRGQFAEKPTILVVALPRTSIHAGADELNPLRKDPMHGAVSGHLWTLAAHKVGELFISPNPDGLGLDRAPLEQNGILRDYPFVQAI